MLADRLILSEKIKKLAEELLQITKELERS